MTESFKLNPAIESVIDELETQRKKIASSKIQGWGVIILGVACFAIGTTLSQIGRAHV